MGTEHFRRGEPLGELRELHGACAARCTRGKEERRRSQGGRLVVVEQLRGGDHLHVDGHVGDEHLSITEAFSGSFMWDKVRPEGCPLRLGCTRVPRHGSDNFATSWHAAFVTTYPPTPWRLAAKVGQASCAPDC